MTVFVVVLAAGVTVVVVVVLIWGVEVVVDRGDRAAKLVVVVMVVDDLGPEAVPSGGNGHIDGLGGLFGVPSGFGLGQDVSHGPVRGLGHPGCVVELDLHPSRAHLHSHGQVVDQHPLMVTRRRPPLDA